MAAPAWSGASIGGLKVTTENGWFAARPSGTEDVYKIYAESFRGRDHLKALQADFTLADAPDKDGLQWVVATPKAKDGQLQTVHVGFKAAELAALEILDSFGQRSRLTFNRLEVNPALPASSFQFKPPAGADLIKQIEAEIKK